MLQDILQFIVLLAVLVIIVRIIFWLKNRGGSNVQVKKEPILTDDSPSNLDSLDVDINLQPVATKPIPADKIITMTLMAKPGTKYAGYELLQALLAAGFRYGDMNIFHRHENSDGTGRVLFSLAQAVNPGTFNLSDVGAISCPGLTLFMSANDDAASLDLMIDTAKQLIEELSGDIYDDERKPFSTASVDRWHRILYG